MDCNCLEAKNEFYRDLSHLSIANFKIQLDYLGEAERHIGGPFSVPADGTVNDDYIPILFRLENVIIKIKNRSTGRHYSPS